MGVLVVATLPRECGFTQGSTQRGIRRSHDAQGEALLLVFALKQSVGEKGKRDYSVLQ